jgi:probable HAF family extracellular repeat protein
VHATASRATPPPPHYNVATLDPLGGNNARGNSINDIGMVQGYSTLAGEQVRHAALWAFGHTFDLGTLGNPATSNSAVLWPVKNVIGVISGISQTDTPDPNHETWSCGAFFGGPYATGNTCRGFVWEFGSMRALPTLGGNNGFATGTNNWRQTVGWTENAVFDSTCVLPQKLQFRPVVWGPGRDQIHELPLLAGDTSGSATAINDRGQVVGISGICDQAFGRSTARHAVMWEHGHVTNLGDFGADYWNTPVSINQRGDAVGFAGEPGDFDGAVTHAFIWTREHGLQRLDPGADDNSVAYGINERR